MSGETTQVTRQSHVLAINAGSSSLKFAVFPSGGDAERSASGRIERIGLPGTLFASGDIREEIEAPDHVHAAEFLIDRLGSTRVLDTLRAVGHRIVHGGPDHHEPAWITPELLDDLRGIAPMDPDHMPAEIALIDTFRRRLPKVPQLVCFDTGFHHDLPRAARVMAIPRRYQAKGVRRYGFHGLSYAYLTENLESRGRVILAHLGNGASLAAVRDGKPVDTSMAFTPASGVPMSTRSGDLDPGLGAYLARTEGMSPEAFHTMVNTESGLLGISETSPDVRDLLEREGRDERAAEALEVFCYHVKKWIGAFAAALGGVDVLVFAGGIGEHAPAIRRRICDNLDFLGIALDPERNRDSSSVISPDGSPVTVRVMKTDEELMIARAALRLLESGSKGD